MRPPPPGLPSPLPASRLFLAASFCGETPAPCQDLAILNATALILHTDFCMEVLLRLPRFCLSPKTAGLAAAGGTTSPAGRRDAPAVGWAGPAVVLAAAVPTHHGKGLSRGILLQPQCTILKRPSRRRAQAVGRIWSGPLCAWAIPMCVWPCCSVIDPSPCHKPHSPSRPSEAPAFLAKPGSSTHVGECGCDAASTGHLSPAAPAFSELSPALLPEPAGTVEKWSRRRIGRSRS